MSVNPFPPASLHPDPVGVNAAKQTESKNNTRLVDIYGSLRTFGNSSDLPGAVRRLANGGQSGVVCSAARTYDPFEPSVRAWGNEIKEQPVR